MTNKDFCNSVIPSKDSEILEFNQNQKYNEFVICADLKFLMEKIDGYQNNLENLFPSQAGKHILLDFSMSTISLFVNIEKRHDIYRSKDCMKKFCESLREQEMKIINF